MPIPRVVDADTAILRLQQSVNRASRTRFLGCFSLYLSMGNMAAQTNQTKPNKQNHGYDPNPRNGRREGGTEARARTDERGDEDDDERVRANCRDMMP